MVFLHGLHSGISAEMARTMAFSVFVVGDIGLIVLNCPRVLRFKDTPFFLILLIAALALACAIYLPALRSVFGFAPLEPLHWAVIIAVSALAITLNFLFRVVLVKRRQSV